MNLYIAIKITAKGTDEKTATGEFYRRQLGKFDGKKWELANEDGPDPKLPKTWEPE